MNVSQNAKFALVIGEIHKGKFGYAASESWKTFLMNVRQTIPPAEKTERITENIWLIPIDSELPVLAALVQALKDFGVPMRVLFLEEAPDWIKYPPDAKPDAEAKPSQATS